MLLNDMHAYGIFCETLKKKKQYISGVGIVSEDMIRLKTFLLDKITKKLNAKKENNFSIIWSSIASTVSGYIEIRVLNNETHGTCNIVCFPNKNDIYVDGRFCERILLEEIIKK